MRVLAYLVQWEARLRHYGASRGRDRSAANIFEHLRAIATDMGRGCGAAARRRLQRVVRRQEQQHAA